MATRMLQRRGTAAEWTAQNPILADGEFGYERDTKNFKIGDGVTAWNALIYSNITHVIQPLSTASVGLTVKSLPAQAADPVQVQDSTGTVVGKIDTTGAYSSIGATTSAVLNSNGVTFNRAASPSYITQSGLGGTIMVIGSRIAGSDTNIMYMDPNTGIRIGANDYPGPIPGTAVRLVLRGNPFGQTADIWQVQTGGGSTALRTSPSGTTFAQQVAAGTSPLVVKAVASPTSDLILLQDSGGVSQAGFGGIGQLALGDSPTASGQAGWLYINNKSSGGHGAAGNYLFRGYMNAAQSVNPFEIRTEAAATVFSIDQNAMVHSQGLSFTNAPNGGASLFGQVPAGQGAGVAFVLFRNNAGSDIHRIMPHGGTWIGVDSATEVGLTIKQFTGQTADAFQVQNSGGGVVAKFDKIGRLLVNPGTLASFDQSVIDAAVMIGASSTADRNLVMRQWSGQTVNMTEWQNNGGTIIAAVTSTGNVQGTGAYTTLSDASAKSNVRGLKRDPMKVIQALRPTHYDYKGGEMNQVGFVADDVLAVLPEAVVPWDLDRLGLRTDAILAYLVGAVQQLSQRLPAAT